ncbi:glucosaminidase domain-containing protein [Enterococcus pallens]|uniref:Mannosyl-glycoprotein endo-beta-N-acetylglucosamidase-like domain-containing protein n=1 Tax=Enterococcus pallens ATCC BAA-351 TaxID=1158607 RepID=R2TBT6_9ENTE|nr:glucosaminidase domain-containing protein [Enterococcus pallens]EOH97699.1 hypothetical protein UAU_00367 [Enterococcus pallens ATCC BAA-351]EOU20882.1 hypothetical protein I588_01729 [Enterococcus pallens ATCC BAA-351]
MKGKILLGSLALGIILITGNQLSIKQIVLAEVRESADFQLETAASTENGIIASSSTASEPVESTISLASSIKESRSSEASNSSTSTILSSELEKTEESNESSLLISEVTNKIQTNLPAKKVEENYQFSVSKNQTTEAFIQVIGKDAQVIAWQEDLYASVMIAQAILETGSGNSQLARPPHHNLFGIKGSYQGKNVSFNTQEDKGNGQLYTIQSAFRQYPSYKESLEDYAVLLKKGISGNAGFYQATWKEYAESYQVATKGLTGKYATDTFYDKKLNALIQTYHLTVFDADPDAEEENPSSKDLEISEESTESSVEQIKNEKTESSTPENTNILTSETKQTVVTIPPITQRPAKEVTGNRTAQ